MVELGESVGILAAQSIGEPGTQLTMRTFHTGGVFSGEVAKTILSPQEGIVDYEPNYGGKKISTKFKEKAFLTLRNKKLIINGNNANKAFVILPKNSIVFVKPREFVFEKQIIAEIWNDQNIKKSQKQTTREPKEIKANISGQILIEKKQENNKKARLWIINRNLLSYESIYKNLDKKTFNKNFKAYKSVKHIEKNIKTTSLTKNDKSSHTNYKLKICFKYLRKEKNINLQINNNYNYFVKNVVLTKKEIILSKTKKEKLLIVNEKEKKIGKFLEKETTLQKNRKNKYPALITQKKRGIISVNKANSYANLINQQSNVYNHFSIKKNNVLFNTYFTREKTEDIVQGLPKIEELLEAKRTFNLEKIVNNPHERLVKKFKIFKEKYNKETACRKSIEKIQFYLIENIQQVYEAQGVKISRKHMEIIVKQMTSKVIITSSGNTSLLNGEIVSLSKIEELNKNKNSKIEYEPILMGITKLSLSNQSFISEASFQETTKVLTRSAIQGKIDWLQGLKENLIMGNLIPAGTGYKN